MPSRSGMPSRIWVRISAPPFDEAGTNMRLSQSVYGDDPAPCFYPAYSGPCESCIGFVLPRRFLYGACSVVSNPAESWSILRIRSVLPFSRLSSFPAVLSRSCSSILLILSIHVSLVFFKSGQSLPVNTSMYSAVVFSQEYSARTNAWTRVLSHSLSSSGRSRYRWIRSTKAG